MERDNDYFDVDFLRNGGNRPEDRKKFEQREKERKRFFYCGMVIGMAAALLIVCCVYLGTRIQSYLGMRGQQMPRPIAEGSIISQDMLDKIQDIEGIINKYFYLDGRDPAAMEDGVYRGLVDSLGDPYSVYFSQEELAELMDQTEGIYYGIGAFIGLDAITSYPKITGIISGTPAEEAELRENDIIYEVDGESTYGLELNDVVKRIKGEEGSKVMLTIVRDGEPDYLHIEVTRRKVESPTVNFEMLRDGNAYIQITEFDNVTTDQFADAMAMARGSGMKGLVLDLRSNPGGNLSTVVDIARMLLPEGLVVYTEDKNGHRQEYKCDGTRAIEVPVTVLINGNSASASEILAGAIKDYGIGTLVGTTTFGKGIVQQIIPLEDHSAVKVTISSYFTPNGNDIHGIGVAPDVECEFDREAFYAEEGVDNQLEKAIEVLNELK